MLERELKLNLINEIAYNTLLALYQLQIKQTTHYVNFFFDTKNNDLQRQHIMFRVRVEKDNPKHNLVTVKQLNAPNIDGVIVREEYCESLPEEQGKLFTENEQLQKLDLSVIYPQNDKIKLLIRSYGSRSLKLLGSFATIRTNIMTVNTDIVELVIDRSYFTTFQNGEYSIIPDYELECELDNSTTTKATIKSFQDIFEMLQIPWIPNLFSKYERYLKIRG
jgi:uncharacterized protein YjbK